MAKTKQRRGTAPKRRDRRSEALARETQAAQRLAEKKKLTLAGYRRRRIFGWTLVSLAIVVGVTHWMEHLGFFSFASSGVEDLVAGYPMAVLLGVAGTIVLSK